MSQHNQYQITIRLSGTRPIMFDRYPGDNSTKLPVEQKLNLDDAGGVVLPAINLMSMLAAENTKSAIKMFINPKAAGPIRNAVNSFFNIIEQDIPLMTGDRQITIAEDWGTLITVHRSVARMAKGIPNPKERPMISRPWFIEFEAEFIESAELSLIALRSLFDQSRRIGLGTFRPIFGQFVVDKFDAVVTGKSGDGLPVGDDEDGGEE
jgi:hypothetical protein